MPQPPALDAVGENDTNAISLPDFVPATADDANAPALAGDDDAANLNAAICSMTIPIAADAGAAIAATSVSTPPEVIIEQYEDVSGTTPHVAAKEDALPSADSSAGPNAILSWLDDAPLAASTNYAPSAEVLRAQEAKARQNGGIKSCRAYLSAKCDQPPLAGYDACFAHMTRPERNHYHAHLYAPTDAEADFTAQPPTQLLREGELKSKAVRHLVHDTRLALVVRSIPAEYEMVYTKRWRELEAAHVARQLAAA